MAYNPISGFTLQVITQTGEVASDYYLKFYQANTTTPLSMATDSAGGTLLAKAKLSDSGFPISNPLDNSTVFIPHMNASYRLVIYTSEADADADNTAAAYVNVPFVSTLVGATSLGTAAYADVQTSPTDATAGAVLSNETTSIGGFVNYTGANYQPNDSLGIGVVRYMQNNSGATHSNGQTGIAGSALKICFGVGSSGLWASSSVSVVGTWTQVAGNTVGDQNYGLYVRNA